MNDAVAVVIPAWNLGDELSQAVESVLSQGPRVRVIVVDNASDHPLPALSAEVITLPSRVSVGMARNAGLRVVEEEMVMFMEGDDVLLPGALQFLLDEILCSPDITVVAASFLVWDPQTDRRTRATWPFDYCYRLNRRPRIFALVNCVRNVLPVTGPVLIRTRAAREAGGFADSDWGEDWAFGAVLAFIGNPVLRRRICSLYRVDTRRVTLSDRKEGRVSPAWAGRSDVRVGLRGSPFVPWFVRIATPLLVIPHLYYTLRELGSPRQRVQ